ncbi:4-hydroxy-tetrahydrodipicolinate synthase [Tistlia consotensis]|uniref:4-hydroxy-tetrahydrodipicolinate synthase n=1 Tax=Tistlia consotensis USBA 355 TaxID=560819 RepID=A0A1Y6CAT3_9PROT|nr:dihydrodipicolinate synthase family protein [Tistlia consotensis]SMF45543.1 4-hydroxy-tetrahydrodipicolinate synthase [Tistlia consotensis USBA 355]SNR79708.1 4-hydroxy-tetrahydrodipicolinate synthase [Tistlia consotensis]
MTSQLAPHPATRNRVKALIGTSAALVTPFEAGGAVDWHRFAGHAKHLLDQGPQGGGMTVVTAFGTTGEGVSIPREARADLYERMEEHGVAAGQLVEGVYGPVSAEAGRHLGRSLAAGAAAILLAPPFYFKGVPDEGLYRWFAEAFEAAGGAARDVILYNIPQLTGVPLGPALVGRLRDAFPEVVAGVKDSAGDWPATQALLAEHRDLAILVGHEGHLAQAVRAGASGAISGLANVAPGLVAKLVSGEEDPRTEKLLARILALAVVPAVKALTAGQTGDHGWLAVRAPLVAMDAGDAEGLWRELGEMLQ